MEAVKSNRNVLVLRLIGFIGAWIALVFTSVLISKILGMDAGTKFSLDIAGNTASASLALIIGYFLHPKIRRQSLSTTIHIVIFVVFMIIAAILKNIIVISSGSEYGAMASKRQGIFLMLEIVVGYVTYYLALRKYREIGKN